MEVKYLAVEIKGEIFVMNDNDELGGLIDGDIPHTVIGRVCTERCNTTCLHYRGGTCPCKAMKDADGRLRLIRERLMCMRTGQLPRQIWEITRRRRRIIRRR